MGGTTYKIILRHASGWQKYKHARIHVSVPASPGFDPRLRSIIEWSAHKFDQVTLCLHDTLQRYNLMAQGLDARTAYETALRNGDMWLHNNIYAPDVFIDLLRWNQVLGHPSYASIHEEVQDLYRNNMPFAEAIDHDLNTFSRRCKRRGESFEPDRVFLSREFLLEEVSGYIPLYREVSAVDMLPGMRMKAMQLLLDGLGSFELRDNLMLSVKTFDVTAEERT